MSSRIVGKPEIHRSVYFSIHGDPHHTKCFFCEKDVVVQSGISREEATAPTGVCIHHIDGDHYNNAVDNLVATHNSCHMKHHRELRPLVAKGSTLPEEWKSRVAANLARRMSVDENRQQIASTMRDRVREHPDFGKPLYCDDCGAGPFIGILGLHSHQGRDGCASFQRNEERKSGWEFECSCGRRFKYARSIKRHINNADGHIIAVEGRNPSQIRRDEKEATYEFQCECSKKFRTRHGLSIHKGTACPLGGSNE